MSKNMDSVFADCTDDELEFDILFDDVEDDLVDLVAGCNEAGVLFTEDFEGLTEAQLLENEGIDDVEPEETVAPEDESAVCPTCGKAPCECASVKKEAADVSETEGITITDETVDAMLEALDEDPIADTDDAAEREGKVKHDTDNVEGVSTETPADAMEKDSKEADPIADQDDAESRDGKVDDQKAEDGVDQPVVGAAAATNANGDVEDAEIEEAARLLEELENIEECNVGTDEKEHTDDEVWLMTGKKPVKESAEDPIADTDDAAEREGKVKHDDNDLEATKDEELEIGGEVGDGKEVTGKEDSAEANAHDDTEEGKAIGVGDKQQTSLEASIDEILDSLAEDAAEGPLEDDDAAERAGEPSDEDGADPALADNAFSGAVEETVDALIAALDEEVSEDPIADTCDTAEREGEVKHDTSDVEGVKQELIGKAVDGKSNEDPIEDQNDAEARDGKVNNSGSEEGVDQKTVQAALEDAEFVDDLLAAIDDEAEDHIIPDTVKVNEEAKVDEEEIAEDMDDEDIAAIASDADEGVDDDLEYEDGDDDDLIAAIDGGFEVPEDL